MCCDVIPNNTHAHAYDKDKSKINQSKYCFFSLVEIRIRFC